MQEKMKVAYWDRQFGDAGDAIDWALDHISTKDDQLLFLEEWRLAGAGSVDFEDDWPEYMRWLSAQHEGARAASPERNDHAD